jgi:hypothetical protein
MGPCRRLLAGPTMVATPTPRTVVRRPTASLDGQPPLIPPAGAPTVCAADPIALRALSDPDQVEGAVTIVGEDGLVVGVNRACTELHAIAADVVVGRPAPMLADGVMTATTSGELWAAVRRGVPWEADLADRGPDGRIRVVHSRVVPVHDPTGHLRYLVVLQRPLPPLGGEADAIGQAHVDLDGRCTVADDLAATLLVGPDGTGAQLVGRGLLAALDPSDAEALREVIELALTHARRHRLDVPAVRGWVHITVDPQRSGDGTRSGAVLGLTRHPVATT